MVTLIVKRDDKSATINLGSYEGAGHVGRALDRNVTKICRKMLDAGVIDDWILRGDAYGPGDGEGPN